MSSINPDVRTRIARLFVYPVKSCAGVELSEALHVNPYDVDGFAAALHESLTMPADEQRRRMRLMRTMVDEQTVYHWAAQILTDVCRLAEVRQ